MGHKNQTESPGPVKREKSIAELETGRKKLARFILVLAMGVVIAMVGVAWGIRDWIAPNVSTSQTWTLPISLLFFVEMVGLFAFCLQQLKSLDRRIKQKQSDELSL